MSDEEETRRLPVCSWWRIPVRVPERLFCHDGVSSEFAVHFPKQELKDDGAALSIFPSDPTMPECR